MRMLSKVLAGSAAMAILVSVGLAGSAQAQVTGSQVNVRASVTLTPSTVPAGVVTGISVSDPCTNPPASITGFPAPNGTTTNLQAVLGKPTSTIAGVWPPTPPTSYTITVTCGNGTKATATETVQSGPAPADVVGVGSDSRT